MNTRQSLLAGFLGAFIFQVCFVSIMGMGSRGGIELTADLSASDIAVLNLLSVDANGRVASSSGFAVATGQAFATANGGLWTGSTGAASIFKSGTDQNLQLVAYGDGTGDTADILLQSGNATQWTIDQAGDITGAAGNSLNSPTLTDGTASLASGSLTGAVGVTASGTVQGGTLTDGTASLSSGAWTSLVSVDASGTVTAGLFDDGTLEIASGSITDAVGLTASGTVSAGTLTDGALSSTAGTVTGAVGVTASGSIQAANLIATTQVQTDSILSEDGLGVTTAPQGLAIPTGKKLVTPQVHGLPTEALVIASKGDQHLTLEAYGDGSGDSADIYMRGGNADRWIMTQAGSLLGTGLLIGCQSIQGSGSAAIVLTNGADFNSRPATNITSALYVGIGDEFVGTPASGKMYSWFSTTDGNWKARDPTPTTTIVSEFP